MDCLVYTLGTLWYFVRLNKTGTRQYTWAIWRTFAEIHSRYTPRFIDHALFGVLEFPVRICDALPITTHTTHTRLIYPEYDCGLITGFPCALVFTCTFTECVT